MRGWVMLLVLAACGRLGFEPSGDGGTTGDTGPAMGPWTNVTAGNSHLCALTDTGETWCWGNNNSNELGTGAPQAWSAPPGQLPGAWKTFAHGGNFSCGIQLDGSLWCWGANYIGQLGDGTMTDHAMPNRVGTETDWIEISAAASHACGRRADMSAWCWGNNSSQQYDAAMTSYRSPKLVLAAARSIAAAAEHTIAIRGDGVRLVSGLDYVGELGTGVFGTMRSGLQPIAGEPATWASIYTRYNHSCGIQADGSLWCWGVGDRHVLGLPDSMYYNTPQRVGTATDWAHVDIGAEHMCGTKLDGSHHCWGSSSRGAFGAIATDLVTPMPLPGGPYRALAIDELTTCTIDMLGALRCSGGNDHGQITGSAATTLVPTRVDPGPWAQLNSYRAALCSIDSGARLYCWGRNYDGELGDGSNRDRQVPTQIGAAGWTAVSVGDTFSVGVVNNMLVWWGNGGTRTPAATPLVFTDWKQVAAGTDHVCALRMNGDLYCWGHNYEGQVGNNTTGFQATPTLVGTGYTQIAAGTAHTCGLSGPNLVCWGNNDWGQIGDATQSLRTGPTNVLCSQCTGNVTKLVVGDQWACALLTSKALWCWGRNNTGQFGAGSATSVVSTPVLGGATALWDDISAGDSHLCALSGGALWCWGHGDHGQLGNNALPDAVTAPIRIGTSTAWTALAAYNHGTCGLQSDGSRWCWGASNSGQYGDDTSWLPAFVVVDPRR